MDAFIFIFKEDKNIILADEDKLPHNIISHFSMNHSIKEIELINKYKID